MTKNKVRAITLMHAAGMLFTGGALAQTPSFTRLPIDTGAMSSYGNSISHDGRFIAGTTYRDVIGSETVFSWDTQTSQVRELTAAVFFGVSPRNTIILDSGRVFWDIWTSFDETAHRIHRWDPSTGQDTIMPGPATAELQDRLQAVSRDGMILLGKTKSEFESTGSAYFIDFSFPTLTRMPLNAGDGNQFANGAGITIPINNARFAYGTVSGNGTVSGMNWFLPNPTPMVQPWEVLRISPRADYQIGKIGETFYLYGDGTGRLLSAPSNPIFMSDPQPVALCDDGSTVIGSALHPFGNREAVLWRKGYAPILLKTALINAGITPPSWSSSLLTDITADGSTAVGTFYEANGNPHAFRSILPAANDLCTAARPVTYGTTISSTIGATRSGVSGTCAAEGNAPDVWFSFVPIANESITIDTCGSNFDTTLALYQTSNCNSLGVALVCNDEASPACGDNVHASRIAASVFAGQNYFIRVSGWNNSFGSIKLNVTAPNRPVNDSCAQAIEVNSGQGAFFNNSNAITDNRPTCGGTPFNDIWFRTVAPESGRMTYATCGSTINTVMNVYPGSACGDLNASPLACGSSNAACAVVGGGNGTRITVPCVAGESQLVRVGGLFGSSGGGTYTARFACDTNVLSNYNVAVVNSAPRAYWRFDDSGALTVADAIRPDPYSCGANPGEYVGATRSRAYQGSALKLFGTGAHARVETIQSMRISDTSVCASATLEAWVKTSDPYAGVVLTNRNAPSEYSLTLVIGYNPYGETAFAGKVLFASDGPGTFFGTSSGVRVDDDRWHHIAARRRSPCCGVYQYELFIDGINQGYRPMYSGSVNTGTGGAYWLIGNGTAWPTDGAAFNGQIDEVAIYCGLLSDPEINNHYTIGHPCLADINLDHVVDFFDYLDFVEGFSAGSPEADFNRDTVVDFFDYLDFLSAFTGPC